MTYMQSCYAVPHPQFTPPAIHRTVQPYSPIDVKGNLDQSLINAIIVLDHLVSEEDFLAPSRSAHATTLEGLNDPNAASEPFWWL